MEEENVEEPTTNPEEEVTSEKETSVDEQETSENPVETPEDLELKNRQLYARTKKAEAKMKELEEKLNTQSTTDDLDAEKIAEITSAFSGMDSKERERLLTESKAKGISLGDARKDEDFGLWRSSYRAKKEKNKAPTPSTKQDLSTASSGDKAAAFRDGRMTAKEKEKYLLELGVVRDYGPPKKLERLN